MALLPHSRSARLLATALGLWLSLLVLVLPALAAAQPTATAPAAPPRIGVMTMQPGEVFFERFGHDALVVADADGGQATSYNFGFFDPSEPDFLGNFVRGRMMYYLVALPLEEDLAQYRQAGRGVSIQWLDLPADQADALAAALAEHARPENARYHYDYFTANCATKVRDMLDTAMGGALQEQLADPAGQSYRSEAVRLASPAPWMWIGFDLGLGPYADQPLSRWQDAFIPMRLAADLATVSNRDGRPLVAATETLLPQRVEAEPAAHPRHAWPWILAGLALAAGVVALRQRPRLLVALALPLWLLCGLGGVLLLYLWGFTAHEAAWGNRNLLLLNPLCLPIALAALPLLRPGRRPGCALAGMLVTVALLALAAVPVHLLALRPQANLPWIGLLLPVHLALAWILRPRRGMLPTACPA